MTKKKITKKPTVPEVNKFDELFEAYSSSEGVAHLDKDTAKLISEARTLEDNRIAKVAKEGPPSKKYKALRTVALEVIRTVFIDPAKWELRSSAIGRMKTDPRVIFALSTTDGWTFAGINTGKDTHTNVIKCSVNYVLPGLMAETIIRGTGDSIMSKAPLEKRIPIYMGALQSDIIGTIKKAQQAAGNKPPADVAPTPSSSGKVVPLRRKKKQSRAKRKGRK